MTTSNLDIEHQIRLMEILKELTKKGIGIIMASHDISLAATYSNEVVLIGSGRIIDSGRPDEISKRDSLKRAIGVGIERVTSSTPLFGYQLIK